MNSRRRSLLVLLAILVLAPAALGSFGGLGPIEVTIWFVLLAAWVVAFVVWARSPRGSVQPSSATATPSAGELRASDGGTLSGPDGDQR